MEITKEKLDHLIDVVYTSGDIPEPTKQILLYIINNSNVTSKTDLINIRNKLLCESQFSLTAISTWSRAKVIELDVRRKRRGEKCQHQFVERADNIHRLPETQRQIFNILKRPA